VSGAEAEVRDEGGDEIAPPPITPATVGKRMGRPPKVIQENAEKDARTVVQWLRELGHAGKDIRLQLYRIEPRSYLGQQISGYIKMFDQEIDEDQIQIMYGGGKYQVKLSLPDDKGNWRFATAHTFEISGLPKIQDETKSAMPPKDESSVAMKAMEVMSGQIARLSDGDRRGGGADADAVARAVQLATQPLYSTIERLTTQLETSQAAAEKARTAPPDPVRDRILEKVMGDDTSRMETLRMAHASEVSTLRQSMVDLEARLRDKHDRDLTEIRSDHKSERDRTERQHTAELALTQRSYDAQIADLKRSYDSQIAILRDAHTREINSLTMVSATTTKINDNDTKRMERENSDLRAEVKALREKKDKSIFEQAKEMEEIKDLFGGGDGEEKKGWERAIEAVGNLPAVTKVISKLAGGDPGSQPGQPPPHVPFVGQDGQMYVHDGQGNVALVPPRPKRLKQRPQRQPIPPAPTPPPPDAPPEAKAAHAAQAEAHAKQVQDVQVAEALATIDPETVKMAVSYLENAFRGNQEPQTVASSLRSQGLVPQAVIQFMRDQGVDVLLEKVARLESSSPFATQAGRNWIRKVAKELIG
jgi:hypothetical protein